MKIAKIFLLTLAIICFGSIVKAQSVNDLNRLNKGHTRFIKPKSHTGRVILPNTLYMNEFSLSPNIFTLTPTATATLVGSTSPNVITDIAFGGTTLYGITFSDFLKINPNNGAVLSVQSTGFGDLNALATNPANGQVFAAGGGNLVQINPVTGVGTLIGSFGSGLWSAGDLAFRNGVLYATVNGSGFSNTWLAKVNTVTGTATLVGDTGFPNVWGLAVRPAISYLYGATAAGQLIRINPVTGVGALLGNNGVNQAGLATSP